ncbi:MAG: reverse transcriptase domain-containing protein [Bacteroidota bacterium]|nr:reverse transcriptase domain-containing protein [Bacteroidota bacterium]
MEMKYLNLCFVRYADDIIVHCNSLEESEEVLASIKERLRACNLELNGQKTKIVHCTRIDSKYRFKWVKFDFLGFNFQPRPTMGKNGKMFLGYDCSISIKSETKIVETFRRSNFHCWTEGDITRIADVFNPKISGWINYFGKFRKYNLMRVFKRFNWRLIKWAVKRYKRFKGSRQKEGRWVRELATSYPGLFVHWQHGFQTA